LPWICCGVSRIALKKPMRAGVSRAVRGFRITLMTRAVIRTVELTPKWHTVAEVAAMLGYGLTKTKMLIISGDLQSLKDGRSRRILPEWVDEYVARRVAEAERDAA
jgi:excisionase family DNA binding protein